MITTPSLRPLLVGAAVAILAVGPAEEPAVMPAVEATPGGAAILLGGSF